jgi:hypothetical protein
MSTSIWTTKAIKIILYSSGCLQSINVCNASLIPPYWAAGPYLVFPVGFAPRVRG